MTRADRTETAGVLRAMMDESRRLGRDLGHADGIRDASRVLLRMIDAAKDARVREELVLARRRIERLTTEPLTMESPCLDDQSRAPSSTPTQRRRPLDKSPRS